MIRSLVVGLLAALFVVPVAVASLASDGSAALDDSCEWTESPDLGSGSATAAPNGDTGTLGFSARIDGAVFEYLYCVLDADNKEIHRESALVSDGPRTIEREHHVPVSDYGVMLRVRAGPFSSGASGSSVDLADCVGHQAVARAEVVITPASYSGATYGFECMHGGVNATSHSHDPHASHGGSAGGQNGGADDPDTPGARQTPDRGSQDAGGLLGAASVPVDARITLAAALTGAAGFLALLVGKWSLIRLAFLGGFSRITRPKALDQETRAAIHRFIEQNPGAEAVRIMEAAETKPGQTMHHLGVLAREGLVTSVLVGGTRHYFVRGSASIEAMRQTAVLRNPTVRLVHAAIQRSPQASVTQIAGSLGVSKATVSKAARRLADAGLVDRRRRGRFILLSASPAARSA